MMSKTFTTTTRSSRVPFRRLKNGTEPLIVRSNNKKHVAVAKKSLFVIATDEKIEVHHEDNDLFPHQILMAKLEKTIRTQYPPSSTAILTRAAIEAGDPEWKKDGIYIDPNNLTQAQVGRIRYLIASPTRSAVLEEMGRLVLRSQFGQEKKVFGPSFWYSVLKSYDKFRRLYSTTTDVPKRFDMLFGFTYEIYQNDKWMTHHARGWQGEKMVYGLAKRWKDLLRANTPEEMELDLEFSYPAVLGFLQCFKAKVESVETYGDPCMLFDYK